MLITGKILVCSSLREKALPWCSIGGEADGFVTGDFDSVH